MDKKRACELLVKGFAYKCFLNSDESLEKPKELLDNGYLEKLPQEYLTVTVTLIFLDMCNYLWLWISLG